MKKIPLFLHYVTISFRGIFNDKTYTAINVLGLSVSISCCFLLIFWIRFQLSFESCFPKADRIYKVLQVENAADGSHYTDWIRPPVFGQLKNKIPEVQAATFIYREALPLSFNGSEGILSDCVSSTTDFLKMFSFVYLEGSPETVIRSHGCIVTEEFARKFFENSSAVGKVLSFGQKYASLYKIAAVVKIPDNTQIRFDLLNPFGRSFAGGVHYIMIQKNALFDEQRQHQFSSLLKEIQGADKQLVFQRLKDIHLKSPKEIVSANSADVYGNMDEIYIFSAAVLLILIVAIINYINTSVAKALSRMKEVGVRKITGSSRQQLILRFLTEAFILSGISVVISILFTKWFFPYFSEIMGDPVPFNFDGMTVLIAVGVGFLISLLSGGYAAFYLSSFDPVSVFRGSREGGLSKDRFRRLLIMSQFFLSISILICTAIVYKQIHTIYTQNTGVNRNNILVLETGLWYQSEDFIQRIKRENPDIIDASMASDAPYNINWRASGVSWSGAPEAASKVLIGYVYCDSHYDDVFRLKVTAGKFIDAFKWFGNDRDEDAFDIVINEAFKKMMSIENPLGVTITYGSEEAYLHGKIIGIVKDFNFRPLREPVYPLILCFNMEAEGKLYIKTTGRNKQQTLNYILNKYKELSYQYNDNKRPPMYYYAEEEYQKMYRRELRSAHAMVTFSVISLILSLLGIASMVSFMVEKRIKEIAIRKISGADTTDIAVLFLKDFILLGAVASVFAIPVCYLIMNNWIQNYIYRTTLDWWIFITVPAVILFIASMVVVCQIFISSNKNAVESLRSE